jgi:hypothetical protein
MRCCINLACLSLSWPSYEGPASGSMIESSVAGRPLRVRCARASGATEWCVWRPAVTLFVCSTQSILDCSRKCRNYCYSCRHRLIFVLEHYLPSRGVLQTDTAGWPPSKALQLIMASDDAGPDGHSGVNRTCSQPRAWPTVAWASAAAPLPTGPYRQLLPVVAPATLWPRASAATRGSRMWTALPYRFPLNDDGMPGHWPPMVWQEPRLKPQSHSCRPAGRSGCRHAVAMQRLA